MYIKKISFFLSSILTVFNLVIYRLINPSQYGFFSFVVTVCEMSLSVKKTGKSENYAGWLSISYAI